MGKKTVWFIVILVALIAIVLVSLQIQRDAPPSQDELISFSADPIDWIETPINNRATINVSEATESRGEFFARHVHFIMPDGSPAALYADGTYQGNIFTGTYEDAQGKSRMRLLSDINPNDGVIEGFGLFKIENGKIAFYFFIDEDWKRASGENINIIWGDDIRQKEAFNVKQFNFTRSSNGIYVDKITHDSLAFFDQNPKWGRIFVGQITKQQILQENYSGTFILFY